MDNEPNTPRRQGHRITPTGLARLGMIGTILTCVACFTPLAVVLLGAIGLARWAGYLDYVLVPLLAVFAALMVIGFARGRSDGTKLKGEI
jgi:hypothetical protein